MDKKTFRSEKLSLCYHFKARMHLNVKAHLHLHSTSEGKIYVQFNIRTSFSILFAFDALTVVWLEHLKLVTSVMSQYTRHLFHLLLSCCFCWATSCCSYHNTIMRRGFKRGEYSTCIGMLHIWYATPACSPAAAKHTLQPPTIHYRVLFIIIITESSVRQVCLPNDIILLLYLIKL